MTNLTQIGAMIGDAGASVNEFINDNKTAVYATGSGLAGVALGVGGASIVNSVRSKKSTSKRRVKSGNIRKRSSSHRKKKNYKYARTAGKRKDTSKRRIRMTKNGQPYVILASGKARFIKKSSAHNSRKRKGGRY